MTCKPRSWFYGNASRGITGVKYGTLTRIATPASLPDTACTVACWVSCRSTKLDEAGERRFYQAAIAYTPQVGHWHFSWGYSANHLAQPPYTGLTPAVNHDYELGIRFTGGKVEAYVIDLATGIKHIMGTLQDRGTMWVDDNPGFIMEGFTDRIREMDVPAFKAYTFNVFLSPFSSAAWPHAAVCRQDPPGYKIPARIHSHHLGSHQYLIGNTAQGSQLANGAVLW